MPSRVWRAAAVLGAALVFGCAAPRENRPETTAGAAEHRMALTPVKYGDLPGWAEDHASEALAALLDQCRVLGSLPAEQKLGGQGEAQALGGTPVQWRAACEAARGVPAGDDGAARGFFESQFQPYAIADNGQSAPSARAVGLFTGYFDPEVAGSRSPGPGYRVALYSRPSDLVQVDLGQFADDLQGRSVSGRVQGGKLVPYFDRAEIEAGALASRRLELIWLADPVDAYFLQVQGSGRVKLPDGHVARVTYNGQNGRRSVLLGKILADRGEIPLDQVSLESIRAWLNSHPDQAEAVLNENPSYVFFREDNSLRPDQGPPGALGVPLTPWRSIAVDRAFIPLGAPVFVATTDPLTGEKLRRLMLAQDVGGAIRGPVRADIFFGWGPDAEARAGRMRQQGSDYVLLPRPAVTASVAR